MQTNPLKALTLLILLGFIWGTGYSIARFATTHGVPPVGYSFWQSLGPAVLISLIFFMRGKQGRGPVTIKSLKYYLICGLTGIVIPNTNMYLASPHLPAGLLAVIVNTVPLMAYPMAMAARLETFNGIRFLGIILAILGLMCIIIPKTSLPSIDTIPWVLTSLITPFSFAFCAIFIARYRPEHENSLQLSAGTLIAASLLLVPWVLTTHHFYALHWPLNIADQVIILEIVLSSIGYILLFQLIKIAGPVYYSLVDTTVALTGLWWGYIIFNETLNQWTRIAVIFILVSLLLVTQKQMSVKQKSGFWHA